MKNFIEQTTVVIAVLVFSLLFPFYFGVGTVLSCFSGPASLLYFTLSDRVDNMDNILWHYQCDSEYKCHDACSSQRY